MEDPPQIMILFRLLFFPFRLLLYLCYQLRNLFGKKQVVVHAIPQCFVMNQPTSWLSSLLAGKQELNFFSFLGFLRIVERSDEIKELIYTVPSMEAPWHQVEEIVAMLHAIVRSGKKLTAYTNGGNLKTLYLMTVAHCRHSSEYANFIVRLPSFETYFAKKALDRLGVSVETQSAGRYKGGGFEMFTRSTSSPQSRQSMSALMKDMRQTLQQGFENSLGLEEDAKQDLLSLIKKQAFLEANDLRQCKFFHQRTFAHEHALEMILGKDTQPLYQRQARHIFDQGLDEKLPTTSFEAKAGKQSSKDKPKLTRKDRNALDYTKHAIEYREKTADESSIIKRYQRKRYSPFKFKSRKSIALVVMEGNINLGSEEDEIRSHAISALPFRRLIHEISENRDEAVFLYINSPGGSADASEILFESIYSLSRIKPVFALLGSVAASGGYYIACAANRIYASPLSITGSIGVIRIRPNLQGLYKKIGIHKENLSKDPTSDMFSETGKISAPARHLLQRTLMNHYRLFLERVAMGRKQKRKELEKMAEGRVFTAKQFQEAKMIDGHLNFIEVLDDYKKSIGQAQEQEYNLNCYPQLKIDLRSLASSYGSYGMQIPSLWQADFLPKNLLNLFIKQASLGMEDGPLFYLPWSMALRNL